MSDSTATATTAAAPVEAKEQANKEEQPTTTEETTAKEDQPATGDKRTAEEELEKPQEAKKCVRSFEGVSERVLVLGPVSLF